MYTVLCVRPGGHVPLFHGHVGRLGEPSRAALERFRATAAPGVYRATWDGTSFSAVPRAASTLVDGMPTRRAVSPFAGVTGRFAKPAPPSAYDAVRVDGLATLLTSPDGAELYESCRASLVAWDGVHLVLPMLTAPAVASLAEAAVEAQLRPRRAALRWADGWPLLLINAVAGTCAPAVEGRGAFPAAARAQVDSVF